MAKSPSRSVGGVGDKVGIFDDSVDAVDTFPLAMVMLTWVTGRQCGGGVCRTGWQAAGGWAR